MNAIIELKDIKRDFLVGNETVHALRGVSFAIQPGEFVTIMGTSGSGKSTLLNVLGCLDTPTAGEYWLDGYSVRQMGKNERAELRNHKIGFVFQSYNLLPKTTSIENVELPLMYNPAVSAKERERRAIEALDSVGLHDRLYHKSNQMSGGQQQRVAVARAVAAKPPIILADEPTGNLDTKSTQEIMEILKELHRSGRTVIIITHDEEIASQAHRVIRILDGRIEEDYCNR
ncbi:MAG TPA: ABC transporter ATP-binding protein [Odoribacter splanchnicus]|nr:ABC transporter ATP-binding protein [Odoribacter splanchnicus]